MSTNQGAYRRTVLFHTACQGSDTLRSAGSRRLQGLTSHWPCATDFSGLSTVGLTAEEKEMSTLSTLLMGYGTLYLTAELA